jgi:hypothetical protein
MVVQGHRVASEQLEDHVTSRGIVTLWERNVQQYGKSRVQSHGGSVQLEDFAASEAATQACAIRSNAASVLEMSAALPPTLSRIRVLFAM